MYIPTHLFHPHISLIVRLLCINGASYVASGFVSMFNGAGELNQALAPTPESLELTIQVITLAAVVFTIVKRVYRHYVPSEEAKQEERMQDQVQQAILLLADAQADAEPKLSSKDVDKILSRIDDTDIPKSRVRTILNIYKVDNGT